MKKATILKSSTTPSIFTWVWWTIIPVIIAKCSIKTRKTIACKSFIL